MKDYFSQAHILILNCLTQAYLVKTSITHDKYLIPWSIENNDSEYYQAAQVSLNLA